MYRFVIFRGNVIAITLFEFISNFDKQIKTLNRKAKETIYTRRHNVIYDKKAFHKYILCTRV